MKALKIRFAFAVLVWAAILATLPTGLRAQEEPELPTETPEWRVEITGTLSLSANAIVIRLGSAPVPPPTAPGPLTAEALSTGLAIQLQWPNLPPGNLAGYKLRFSTVSSTGPWQDVHGGLLTSSEYLHEFLLTGSHWYFVVGVSTTGEESAASNVATAISIPYAPTDFELTPILDGTLRATWAHDAGTGGAATFDVYLSSGGGPFTKHNGSPIAASPYDATGLTNGTLYTGHAVAVVGATQSSPSNTDTGTPADLIAPATPDAPSLVAGDGQITVELPDLVGDEVGFDILTSATSGGTYTKHNSTPETGDYVVTGANGTEIFVKIRALDDATPTPNQSALSAYGSATPVSALTTPLRDFDATNVGSVHVVGSNVISWDDLSGNGGNAIAVGTPIYTSGARINLIGGSGASLTISEINLAQTFDIFIVFRGVAGSVGIFAEKAGADRLLAVIPGSPIQLYYGGVAVASWTQSMTNNVYYLIRVRLDDANHVTAWVNGVNRGEQNPNLPGNYTIDTLIREGNASTFGAGAVRVYAAPLNDAEAALVSAELAAKWSITLP